MSLTHFLRAIVRSSTMGYSKHSLLSPDRSNILISSERFLAARARKRFYKNVSVVQNGSSGTYEVCLDQRKLKTPLGNLFKVPNEALALAVAEEWRAQRDLIMTSQMHITGLCNVAIDNPTGARKEDLAESVIKFLDTDTVLFFSEDNETLRSRQEMKWKPLIDWFCLRHGNIRIVPSCNMNPPTIDSQARDTVINYLMSLDLRALHGFAFGADAIKSVILMTAVTDKRISVEEAVKMARMEVEVQMERWGNVEWAHDLELHDTTSRLAAAAIFVQLTTTQHSTKTKDFI